MERVNPEMEYGVRLTDEQLEAELLARISTVILAAGGVRVVSSATGIPKGTLEKYVAKTAVPSALRLAKIAAAAGVDLEDVNPLSSQEAKKFYRIPTWVAEQINSKKGVSERPVMDPTAGTGSLLSAALSYSADLADEDGEPMIRLPIFPEVRAAAGRSAVAVSERSDGVMSFAPSFLRSQGATPDQCSVIWAHGDSMMPTIPDGSALVVDRSQTEVKNGSIMVIGIDDDLLVKRIRRRMDGMIDLISDNPMYAPETLRPDATQQLRVIGRVVYFCRVP